MNVNEIYDKYISDILQTIDYDLWKEVYFQTDDDAIDLKDEIRSLLMGFVDDLDELEKSNG